MFMGLETQTTIDVPNTSETHNRNKYSIVKVLVVMTSTAFHSSCGQSESEGSVSRMKHRMLRIIMERITDADSCERILFGPFLHFSGSSMI
jgi:hypothetical protein